MAKTAGCFDLDPKLARQLRILPQSDGGVS